MNARITSSATLKQSTSSTCCQVESSTSTSKAVSLFVIVSCHLSTPQASTLFTCNEQELKKLYQLFSKASTMILVIFHCVKKMFISLSVNIPPFVEELCVRNKEHASHNSIFVCFLSWKECTKWKKTHHHGSCASSGPKCRNLWAQKPIYSSRTNL